MDFALPPELTAYLAELDAFIDDKIKPLQAKDDNERFFDHRREYARTDFENNGLPRPEWEELLAKARKLAARRASTAAPHGAGVASAAPAASQAPPTAPPASDPYSEFREEKNGPGGVLRLIPLAGWARTPAPNLGPRRATC